MIQNTKNTQNQQKPTEYTLNWVQLLFTLCLYYEQNKENYELILNKTFRFAQKIVFMKNKSSSTLYLVFDMCIRDFFAEISALLSNKNKLFCNKFF